jgi:hypothetical membrane protein
MILRRAPELIVASSMLAMLEGVFATGASPVRTFAVVWFLSVCPGLAIVGLIRLRDPWLALAVVPALSFSLDVFVSGILSYTGLWSPAAAILILVAVSDAGAVAQAAVIRPKSSRAAA